MVAAALTVAHREAQLALRSRTMRELVRIWPALNWTDLDRSYDLWAANVRPLVTANRATSSNLAAQYLRAYRPTTGVPGRPVIVLAEPLNAQKLETVLQVTSRASIKSAATVGVSRETAMQNAFVRSSGAITRLVLEGGRQTLTESIKADPRAVGYERVTSGNPCAFCAQVADWAKGNDALNADFETHDHCGCSAQPIYR